MGPPDRYSWLLEPYDSNVETHFPTRKDATGFEMHDPLAGRTCEVYPFNMATSADAVPPSGLATRKGSRALKIGIPIALIVLVIGLVATNIVLGRYEPLANGSVFGVDGANFRRVSAYSDQDAAIFRFRDGDVATVKFGLRNEGGWPVRVERLLQPYEFDAENLHASMQPIEVLSGPLISEVKVITPPVSAYRSFQPFTLEPGEERLMAIQFRFEDCRNLSGGGAFYKRGYSVRYSTLWVTNEMEVPFPYNLVVEGPADCTG